jgi:3-isopropylmalate dehydrogenase
MPRIALLPGDGIGPEVIREAEKVLRFADKEYHLSLTFETLPYGAEHTLRTGETVPSGFFADVAQRFDAILLGAFGDARIPDHRHIRDILLGLRFGLDLYINLRPVKLYTHELCPLRGKTEADIDFVVYRENTEGLYADVGGIFKKGTLEEIAINEDVNTRTGVERILRAAFEAARARPRRKLTMVDKSNALRYAHDLWRRAFAEVGADYPDVQREHLYVDVAAMEMVRAPERFDVIVTCNLFGDILTDLAAALVGGLGLAASANLRPGHCSMFEPVHGSAPDIAGKGRANPCAAVLTSALMLDHLGRGDVGRKLEAAVEACVRARRTTPDLGGELTTAQAGDALRAALERIG